MQTEKYTRKSFTIDAVRVTTDNMEEIAGWCGGSVETTDPEIARQLNKQPQLFVHVPVRNPLNDRQKQAFVGDWVILMSRPYKGAAQDYKSFTHKSFVNSFESVYKDAVPGNATTASPTPKPDVWTHDPEGDRVKVIQDAETPSWEEIVAAGRIERNGVDYAVIGDYEGKVTIEAKAAEPEGETVQVGTALITSFETGEEA